MLKKILYIFFSLFLFIIITKNASATAINKTENLDQNNVLYMELKDGIVVIQMLPDIAPNHVLRIRELTRNGFYDGLMFFRVLDGFMAQTGDPNNNGTGGSKFFNLNAEFSKEMHIRGVVSMARAADPNSANSQFFIVTGQYFPHLDRQYSVWGKVIKGMEYVDNIKKGDSLKNGTVENPDKIIKMVVGSDLINPNVENEDSYTVDGILRELYQIKAIQNEQLKKSPSGRPIKSVLEIMVELNR
jgi:peptidylprolyl isomerase